MRRHVLGLLQFLGHRFWRQRGRWQQVLGHRFLGQRFGRQHGLRHRLLRQQGGINRLQLLIEGGLEILLEQLVVQLQPGGIGEAGGQAVLHLHQQHPVVHPERRMHLPDGELAEHGADRGVGLADQHRPHQAAGVALFAERMGAGERAEIGAVIKQPQIQLLSRPLIAQADHAVHHLLKIGAALEKVGLKAFAVGGFGPFLQADLIPAIPQRTLNQLRQAGDPVAAKTGGGITGHPIPEASEHQGLLLRSEADRIAQALQQQITGSLAENATLQQQLCERLARNRGDSVAEIG